jgi:hypothetical protein
MITRADILWLGISSGVTGGLTGGLMLGIGMSLAVHGQPWGFLLIIPGAPASGLIGWILSRRLARQLER